MGEVAEPDLNVCVSVDAIPNVDFISMALMVDLEFPPVTVTSNWYNGLLTSVVYNVPAFLVQSKLVLGVDIWLMSDASKKHGRGAFAWVIATATDILCYNSGLVFAEVKSMTSYRAEAFGVLSLVVFLCQLFTADDCAFKTHLRIHCDNISVVNTAGSDSETKADMDVFLQLRQELQDIKEFLTVEFVHVKGHQTLDQFSSREAVLNHWCDKKAKSVVASTPLGMCQYHFHFPVARVAISCAGTIGCSIPLWL